jgi:hypothetical protein
MEASPKGIQLEAQRRAAGQPMSAEELELDTKIRTWPRTPETDPYQAGLEALGAQMKPMVNGALFALAYNEFCGPTLQEAVEDLINLTFRIRNSRRIRRAPQTAPRCDATLCLAL